MRQVIFLLVMLTMSCSNDKDPVVCPDYTCGDFVNQQDAQDVFDADKECLQVMDSDNDGVACEHLTDGGTGGGGGNGTGGGGTSGCPTTANCGCSGKLKSQCESTCCQWIVGTGCRCK